LRPKRLIWLSEHQRGEDLPFIAGIVAPKFRGVQNLTPLFRRKFAQIPNCPVHHDLPIKRHLMHFQNSNANLLPLLV
jgi:hypothetical protein